MAQIFLNKFLHIGFKHLSTNLPGAGVCRYYKYYPTYLGDNHYTLITFTFGEVDDITNETEYRLYIHNKEGGYVDSKFQCSYRSEWDINTLSKMFDEIFHIEIRDDVINDILE